MEIKKSFQIPFLELTDRQLKVYELISDGLTNSEIADVVYLSKRTVEGIRASLLIMTNTKNTASLISFGFRAGILN